MTVIAMTERPSELIQPALASKLMLWTVAALSVAMLIWAALAQVDEVTSAQGRVIPSRQLQVISNLEGGTVKAIYVKGGARVRAGQPLLLLDSTQFGAEYAKTTASWRALAARVARLEGEVTGQPPVFPAGLEAAAPQIVATERALYRARMADLSAAIGVERARLDQAERAVGQARAEAGIRAEAGMLADSEVATLEPLVAKGIEPRIDLVRARSAQLQARGAVAGSTLAISHALGAVAEARASLQGAQERFKSQSADDLATARTELAAQGVALPALQDRVKRTIIRAPIAGTVNRVLVATVGGTVRPFEPLAEIVPNKEALVVEASLKPDDICFVRIGQRATVKLTAYDYSVYGAFDGTVDSISPDAIVNERTGESHFTIRVVTRQGAIKAQDGSPLPIGAGMIAEVDVLGNKRSVLSYILTPIAKLKDNAFREQ
jgi:membrane fusion protein, adhesin transport system